MRYGSPGRRRLLGPLVGGQDHHHVPAVQSRFRLHPGHAVDGQGLVPHHVATPVGLVDVAPTILALAGILPSAKMGRSTIMSFAWIPPR